MEHRERAEPEYDQQWRDRAAAGDPDAWSSLVDREIGPLMAYCLPRVGRDHDLCRDAVQATFLRAVAAIRSFDPVRARGDAFGWLQGHARNAMRDLLRRKKKETSLEGLIDGDDSGVMSALAKIDVDVFTEETLERDETRRLVATTMAGLRPRDRDLLDAKYGAGRSVREIAAQLGSSEEAVESRLARARDAFRRKFAALARAGANGRAEP